MQAQAVNDQPLQLADTATAAQPPTLSQKASNIGSLHSHFASPDTKLRDEPEELVKKGQVYKA